MRHNPGLFARRRAWLPRVPVRESVPDGSLLASECAERPGQGSRPDAASALRSSYFLARFVLPSRSAAWAAASLATGTRNGEQDT